jgi:hypothetical protein
LLGGALLESTYLDLAFFEFHGNNYGGIPKDRSSMAYMLHAREKKTLKLM